MPQPTFRLTPTAESQLKKIVRETKRQWGVAQARKYNSSILDGLQQLAETHHELNSLHRTLLAEGTRFSLHHIEHHYVAFLVQDAATVIIAGFFHEHMDLPTQLKEFERLTEQEINVLKREIAREKSASGL